MLHFPCWKARLPATNLDRAEQGMGLEHHSASKPCLCPCMQESLIRLWGSQMSAGGLVSALTGVQHFDTLWVGWPGMVTSA